MTTHLTQSEYADLAAVPAKRGRESRKHPEDKLQRVIVDWLRAVLIDCIVFSIPNGAGRSKIEGALLKATGVLPGMFDLCILTFQGKAHFMELKATKGSLSKPQRDMKYRFICLGVPHAIIRSLNDARIAVADWKLQTREVAP